jgi:hypothetical protein
MADHKPKIPFYLIDTASPFYKPLALRSGICIVVVLWAVMETVNHQPFWAVMTWALSVYCLYVLVYAYTPPSDEKAIPPSEPAAAESDAAGSDDQI